MKALLLCLVIVLVLLDLATANGHQKEDDNRRRYVVLVAAMALTIALDDSDEDEVVRPVVRRGRRYQSRNRVRRTVKSIFIEHGPYYVRRAYRMTEEAFWELHVLLKPLITSDYRRKVGGRVKKHRNGGKNGIILTETRLSVAIRYFAGGRPDDIAISHGIAHSEVFVSVWQVVDAVNRCPQLAFTFPECHEEQKKLALGFKERSEVGMDCCVGAIDGLLLWIERPSKRDLDESTVGAKKFFCGRKHKYGMNLQGTCDARGRFLDLSICHPASTSDFLAFTTSRFHRKLETPGFLAPGLCIFGDSAYVNNGYFVTPFKNIKGGLKDDFNFFHSQVRITVECCFGMLVGRWGLMRRAFPQAMSIKKITALASCLCRLHNFCIDHRDDKLMAPALQADLDNLPLDPMSTATSDDLLGVGHHHIDTGRGLRQEFSRSGLSSPSDVLPRDRLLKLVEDSGFKRQLPKKWQS
jgi:DDE superfamily endonuclease